MKLDLPYDHPLAEAIREATAADPDRSARRLILSLDVLDYRGELKRMFHSEIDQWSTTRTVTEQFECSLIDPLEYTRAIKRLLAWPEPPFYNNPPE